MGRGIEQWRGPTAGQRGGDRREGERQEGWEREIFPLGENVIV